MEWTSAPAGHGLIGAVRARSGRADQVDENLGSWRRGHVVALERQSKLLRCNEVELKLIPPLRPGGEHDSCPTRCSAHLVYARSCQTASCPVRRRNADRSACVGHASTPTRKGLLASPDYETCRGFVRRRPLRRRATSLRPLVPLRASGQEAVSERHLQDVERRGKSAPVNWTNSNSLRSSYAHCPSTCSITTRVPHSLPNTGTAPSPSP